MEKNGKICYRKRGSLVETINKKSKWILSALIIIYIITLVAGIPFIKRTTLRDEREKLLNESVERASEDYNQYVQSGSETCLNVLIRELQVYYTILKDLENGEDMGHMYSMSVNSAVCILEEYKGQAYNIEYLAEGLKCLSEDVYSEAGYDYFSRFANVNGS